MRSGDDVIVKPNICVDYHPPEYAATTNPTVVATLVTLCLGAGAIIELITGPIDRLQGHRIESVGVE